MIKNRYIFGICAVAFIVLAGFWSQPARAQGWWPFGNKSLCNDSRVHEIIFGNLGARPINYLDYTGNAIKTRFMLYPTAMERYEYRKLTDVGDKVLFVAHFQEKEGLGELWQWPDLILENVTTIKIEGGIHFCLATIFDRANPYIGRSPVSFTATRADDNSNRTVLFLN